MASHENGVAELISTSIELPIRDRGGELDSVLVYGDGLVAILHVVGVRVQVNLEIRK